VPDYSVSSTVSRTTADADTSSAADIPEGDST
jgi:hypothetical protein